jgi:hypothetical protein
MLHKMVREQESDERTRAEVGVAEMEREQGRTQRCPQRAQREGEVWLGRGA